MAEFGSHQVAPEGNQPSIFEILAQESLSTGLRDAFRHLCKILAENFPEKCGSIFKNFEEIYTFLDFVFQFIHLRIHGASFSEHFYGLRRSPDSRSSTVSTKKLLSWLFFMSVFPYVKLQCGNLFKRIREEESDRSLNQYREYIKVLAIGYRKLYPSVHFLWELTSLIYYVAYALKKSDYYTPLLQITHTKLMSANEDFVPDSWEDTKLPKYRLITFIWKILRKGVESVTLSVSIGAFFLQFLEWWYNREGGTQALCPMPIPPPPSKWPVSFSASICSICNKTRTNDTVLSCSGFVFCYPCIFTFVQENKKCPVTGYPASLDQLIKIYQHETCS